MIPVIVGFIFLRRQYMSSAREIKRVESIARSPIFRLLSESLTVCAVTVITFYPAVEVILISVMTGVAVITHFLKDFFYCYRDKGLVTIRGFGGVRLFERHMDKVNDEFVRANFWNLATARWFGWRLDVVVSI